MKPNDLSPGPVLIAVPHMDDCVLGCGGTIAQIPDKRNIYIVYTTDGRESPKPVFPGIDLVNIDLAPVRANEARAALGSLGVLPDNIHFLDLPDGKLHAHKSTLYQTMLAFIKEINPKYIFVPFRYDRHKDHLTLNQVITNLVSENKIKVQKGVYVAVPGPNLETKAEYRFLRAIGADVVGMSTIPENIVANHMGMKVLGISIVTDECFPDSLKPVNVEEIIATAMEAEPKMTLIMKEVIKRIQ